jgi:DNA-binding Xre family transcriptional regulator
VAELLRQRGLKPYNLIRDAGFSPHASYKLANKDGQFGHIAAETIDRLCAFFGVAPGELFDRTPDAPVRRRVPKSRG